MLQISKKYLVTTNRETILKIPLEVVGILNYTQAQKEPFDIIALAINERLASENDDMTYLSQQKYYKCLSTDGRKTVYLLWDDVISNDRTTELSVTYKYDTSISIDDNSKIEQKEVIDFITKAVLEKYGKDVKIETIIQGKYGNKGETESDADKLTKYKEAIEESKSVLQELIKMRSANEEIINKMSELKLGDNLTEIANSVNVVKEDTTFIRSMISGK